MTNDLIQPGMLKVPVEPACKIDIAGFSLDNYKTFNPEGYTILCRLGETVDGVISYFPDTSKIVIDSNQHSFLVENFEQFIPSLAQDMEVSQATATQKSLDFFSDKQVCVQPVGVQGAVYTTIQSIQNYAPMMHTSRAVSVLKTTGMTGVKIVTGAPLTFVGATYLGAMFFGYCGSLAGNNPVGIICNSASFALSRPMRGIEAVSYTHLTLPTIYSV